MTCQKVPSFELTHSSECLHLLGTVCELKALRVLSEFCDFTELLSLHVSTLETNVKRCTLIYNIQLSIRSERLIKAKNMEFEDFICFTWIFPCYTESPWLVELILIIPVTCRYLFKVEILNFGKTSYL